MATLDEVLSIMTDDDYLHDIQFIIDEDLRTVAIPNKGVVLGVVGDKNINRVNFMMPKIYNGFDMSKLEARIYYTNANNENKYYVVNDKTIENNKLLFSWLVDSNVTAYPGEVKFTVKMLNIVDSKIVNSFSTTIATAKVLEGIDATAINSVNDEFDPLSWFKGEYPNCDSDIPRIYLTGDTSGMTKVNSVDLSMKYVSKNLRFDGIANVKWQGNSSLNYPKKNFAIKLFKDSGKTKELNVNFKGCGEFSKFILKANYIDFSHARNIVSARIWSNVVSDRTDYSTLPNELRTTPNNGAVDGFLVRVFINGIYQGRYTLNYGKDSIMWNMDSTNPKHAALCGENYVSGCFAAEAEIDGSDWSLEFPKVLNDSIKTSFNNAIDFVMNSSDADFVANIDDHFDLESLIDYYIFAYVSCGLDSMGKNQIFLTYDGQHWIASMYDMDSTWGLYWDGIEFVSSRYKCQEDYESGYHRPNGCNSLYTRLSELFDEEIRERYWYLRSRSLSATNIIEEFEKFMSPCSDDLMSKDLIPYPNIPSNETDHATQIRQYVMDRLKYVDFNMTYIHTGVVREDYSPEGEAWSDRIGVDFENDEYIEAKVDSIGSGVTECLLSFGSGSHITEWYNDGPTVHLYTSETEEEGSYELKIDITTNDENSSYAQNSTTVTCPLTVRLDKDGLHLNNSLFVPTDGAEVYNTILADMLTHDVIIVGSVEGSDRSNSHYEYIKVSK